MKIGIFILMGVLVLGAAIQETRGIVKDNPYQSIIDRNAFNLNPPPPPPDTNAPAAPPNKILLTGISSMGDQPKVFLEITEPGPGKLAQKPILTVGEKLYGVEVLEIDAEKGLVRVKNGGVEATLSFEKDGKTNVYTALVGLPIPGASPQPFSSVPTRIVSPTGFKSAVPTPVAGGSPLPSFGGGTFGGGPTTGDGGLRTLPSRTLRLGNTGDAQYSSPNVQQFKPQTAEESILKVAAATELTADLVRRGELPPFPATALTPNPPTAGAANGPGFPQLPTNNPRRTR